MHEGQLAFVWLILSCLGLFLMMFGIRYLKGRENMAMIANGMDPKLNVKRPAPFISLKWGLLLTGAGIGLFFAFLLGEFLLLDRLENHGHDEGGMVAVYFALIAIGGGLGLITSYRIEKKELLDKEEAERKQELELSRLERTRSINKES